MEDFGIAPMDETGCCRRQHREAGHMPDDSSAVRATTYNLYRGLQVSGDDVVRLHGWDVSALGGKWAVASAASIALSWPAGWAGAVAHSVGTCGSSAARRGSASWNGPRTSLGAPLLHRETGVRARCPAGVCHDRGNRQRATTACSRIVAWADRSRSPAGRAAERGAGAGSDGGQPARRRKLRPCWKPCCDHPAHRRPSARQTETNARGRDESATARA